MGDDGSRSGGGKFAVGLGVAASAIAVLTFLGKPTLDQLVNPTPSTSPRPPTSVNMPFIVAKPPSSTTTVSPAAGACQIEESSYSTAVSQQNGTYTNPAVLATVWQAFASSANNAAGATTDPVLAAYLRNEAFDYQNYSDDLAKGNPIGHSAWAMQGLNAEHTVFDYCMSHR